MQIYDLLGLMTTVMNVYDGATIATCAVQCMFPYYQDFWLGSPDNWWVRFNFIVPDDLPPGRHFPIKPERPFPPPVM